MNTIALRSSFNRFPFLCVFLVCAGVYAAPPFTVDPTLFNQSLPDDLGLTLLPGTETHTVVAVGLNTV